MQFYSAISLRKIFEIKIIKLQKAHIIYNKFITLGIFE